MSLPFVNLISAAAAQEAEKILVVRKVALATVRNTKAKMVFRTNTQSKDTQGYCPPSSSSSSSSDVSGMLVHTLQSFSVYVPLQLCHESKSSGDPVDISTSASAPRTLLHTNCVPSPQLSETHFVLLFHLPSPKALFYQIVFFSLYYYY